MLWVGFVVVCVFVVCVCVFLFVCVYACVFCFRACMRVFFELVFLYRNVFFFGMEEWEYFDINESTTTTVMMVVSRIYLDKNTAQFHIY